MEYIDKVMAKRKLECDIFNLIQSFRKETGMDVTDIGIARKYTIKSNGAYMVTSNIVVTTDQNL